MFFMSETFKKEWADPDAPDTDPGALEEDFNIVRAYFNARTDDSDPVYVQLPPEAGYSSQECGLLKRHMYGTRRAAEGWHFEYSSMLIAAGFVQGRASACVCLFSPLAG